MYRTMEELTMLSMRRVPRQCTVVGYSPPRSLNQRSTYNKTATRGNRNFNELRFSFSIAALAHLSPRIPPLFDHLPPPSSLTVSKAREHRAKRSPDNCVATFRTQRWKEMSVGYHNKTPRCNLCNLYDRFVDYWKRDDVPEEEEGHVFKVYSCDSNLLWFDVGDRAWKQNCFTRTVSKCWLFFL